ncbi:Ppx/GppA family phosphatase [Nocardioidaceae bacterium]|nr:Ppx/GppA family phosphatase [Nocardioidaceae bacterium]
MRLGVLDIGSNTGHLLVVDAVAGGAPVPAYSHKAPLRLAEHLDAAGDLSEVGIDALAGFVGEALAVADDKGCKETLAFATSAVREAGNGQHVLDVVRERTGIEVAVLPGEDEARLTFLAVRRWFGWSSHRLAVFDIGGGSLELAAGSAEAPEAALSVPLGAGRLTRDFLPAGLEGLTGVDDERVRALRKHVRTTVADTVGVLRSNGVPTHAVATSKTFRSLARICGAAPSADGPYVRRVLPAAELTSWIPKLAAMSPAEVAELPGVSASRAHQMLAGALVADAVCDLYEVDQLEMCPWALREGVILERLDHLSVVS